MCRGGAGFVHEGRQQQGGVEVEALQERLFSRMVVMNVSAPGP